MDTPHYPRDLALIGAGYWGKNLARNFLRLGVLHAICDGNEDTLHAYGPEYGSIQKTTKLKEILNFDEITSVAIAVPAALHFATVKSALLAKKDVFVEKPLCLNIENARELAALAKANSRILMVGHLLQYHPCIEALLSIVADGTLGKLHYITSNRLNLGKIRHEENVLWSFSPHDISVILALADNKLPNQIRAVGGDYITRGISDTTITTMRFESGLRAHVYASWLNPFKEQKLTVVGTNGMAVFDDTRPWVEKLLLYTDNIIYSDGKLPVASGAKAVPITTVEAEPLLEECRHFVDCCAKRTKPRTDAEEGLRVLKVLQAAQTSLEHDGEAASIVNP